MRKIGTKEYAEILFELTVGKSEEEIKKTLNVFTSYLAKNKSLAKIDEINDAYVRLIDYKEDRVRITLSSKEKLSDGTRKEIEDAARKIWDAKEVESVEKVDDTLIGGWKLRTEDYLIDASIKGRLERLKQTLTK